MDQARSLDLISDGLRSFRTYVADDSRMRTVITDIDWMLEGTRTEVEESVALGRVRSALYGLGGFQRELSGDGLLPALADLKGSGRMSVIPDTVRLMLPVLESEIGRFNRNDEDLVTHQTRPLDPIMTSS